MCWGTCVSCNFLCRGGPATLETMSLPPTSAGKVDFFVTQVTKLSEQGPCPPSFPTAEWFCWTKAEYVRERCHLASFSSLRLSAECQAEIHSCKKKKIVLHWRLVDRQTTAEPGRGFGYCFQNRSLWKSPVLPAQVFKIGGQVFHSCSQVNSEWHFIFFCVLVRFFLWMGQIL